MELDVAMDQEVLIGAIAKSWDRSALFLWK